jgi:hypothetical protein
VVAWSAPPVKIQYNSGTLQTGEHEIIEPMSRTQISVSGLAVMSRDESKIRELYASDWKMWFSDEGDPRHGSRTISEWC